MGAGPAFLSRLCPRHFHQRCEGFQLDRLLEAIRYVDDQWRQRIPTPLINRALQDIIDQRQPPNKTGKRFKLYYAVQLEGSPPAFTLFVNAPHVSNDQYELYLTRQLRSAFGFEGCPIRLFVTERPKSIEPIRRNS